MARALQYSLVVALIALGACTTLPNGPGVLALPGAGKSLDQFRADDLECQQYASVQVGGTTPGQAASDSGMKSAAAGAAAGTGPASASSYEPQRRYDFSYIQCMYVKGHKVPVPGVFTNAPAGSAPPPSPPPPSQPSSVPSAPRSEQ